MGNKNRGSLLTSSDHADYLNGNSDHQAGFLASKQGFISMCES